MNWPNSSIDEPSVETLMSWADQGRMRATDGCLLRSGELECGHGQPSWEVVLGLLPDASGD